MNSLTSLMVSRVVPSVKNLFFVDDSLIFTKASLEECTIMLNTPHLYERASRQVINFEKSAILFSLNMGRNLK